MPSKRSHQQSVVDEGECEGGGGAGSGSRDLWTGGGGHAHDVDKTAHLDSKLGTHLGPSKGKKMPRLIDSNSDLDLDRIALTSDTRIQTDELKGAYFDDEAPDVVVRCGEFAWECHVNVLEKGCRFFEVCLKGGYKEQHNRLIDLPDDEPRAVQAMLRYFYTLDPRTIYRPSDPLFSDVERDLDVFTIADKYNIRPLAEYMVTELCTFYSTDQRPPGDPKGWSAKNQTGFGNVLRKLSEMEMPDARRIREAVANFVVRRDKLVTKWGVVKEILEEEIWLGHEMLKAALDANRAAQERLKIVEDEMREVEEERDSAYEWGEELEEQVDYLEGLCADTEWVTSRDMESYWGYDDYDEWLDFERGCKQYYEVHWESEEAAPQEEGPEPTYVEDVLSGVSFALGDDGPIDVDDGNMDDVEPSAS